MVQRLYGKQLGQPESPVGLDMSPIGGLVKATTPVVQDQPRRSGEGALIPYCLIRTPLRRCCCYIAARQW